jgi:uncharacterized protein with HEPN domain
VNQLPEDLCAQYPQVPWNQPVRLRNRIVHGYWSVDLDVLHAVALGDLPDFVEQIRTITEQLPE